MPKISIIVPVYNVEDYVGQCLESLVRQTMSELEIICINDGSTDSSLSILKEYASKDRRIRLIDKKNEGYGKTMNRGLSEARAPYIGIVESDDFVKPDMFEKLYEAMREQPVDLIKCNFYRYTVAGGENIPYSREYPEDIYGKIIEPLDYPAVYSANSSIWAALYQKQFLDDHYIRFNETPGAAYQDISFHFKVLSSAKKMKIIEDALLYYRSDNLMSSVYSPLKIYCVCDEIHEIENYIRTQDEKRQEKLWPLLTKRKYYDYMWTYNRLAPVFQYAFYEKMTAEFKEDYAAGKFEAVMWRTSYDKENLEQMLKDPFTHFMNTSKRDRDDRIKRVNIRNAQFAETGFWSMVQGEEKLTIYGAGKVGRHVAQRLTAHGIEKEKLLFAVTDRESVQEEIDGIRVKQIDALVESRKDRLILLSVKGEKQIAMLNHLVHLGSTNIIVADEEVLSYLK